LLTLWLALSRSALYGAEVTTRADLGKCPATTDPCCGYYCQKPLGHEGAHNDGANNWYENPTSREQR